MKQKNFAPDEHTKKFCFKCFKWQLLKEFRMVKMQGDYNPSVHLNRCVSCEGKHGKVKYSNHAFPHRAPADDFGEIGEDALLWHWGYVGNKPYKEICEIYKIQYDEAS
jgi:hypothetical protein